MIEQLSAWLFCAALAVFGINALWTAIWPSNARWWPNEATGNVRLTGFVFGFGLLFGLHAFARWALL